MRQLFTTFLILFLTTISAQTYTQAFNEPVIGDIDKKYNIDTSAYTSGLPTAVTGSTAVWDFKKLLGAFPVVVDSFISRVGTPAAGTFSTASYAQKRGTLITYFKSSTSPQQTELLGAYSPSLSITFSNTAVIANYPISYGYNSVDPVGGSFKYNGTTGVCNGSITITADGLGTVNFANNVSIQNVLRLKSVETLTLTIGIIPFGTFNQTVYNYYKPGQKFPILNVNYTVYQLIAGTPTITAELYGSNNYFTVAGINETIADETTPLVYPNPFSERLQATAAIISDENEFCFFDEGGKLVLKTKSLNVTSIEKLDHGIYFLEITNKRGTFRQKLIKN